MFGPIEIPFGAKMLFNTVRLKPGVSMESARAQLEAALSFDPDLEPARQLLQRLP